MSFEISEKAVRKVYRLYREAVHEIVKESVPVAGDVTEDRVFRFDAFPELRRKIRQILQNLLRAVVKAFRGAQDAQWIAAGQRNEALVRKMFGSNVPDHIANTIISQNKKAMAAARVTREMPGKELSKSVWKYVKPLAPEMEMVIDSGLLSGKSAKQIARESVQFLKDPNKRFRRVRDQKGKLRLSKAAKLYHPGQGVSRSSYKNAERMARTTINNSYRQADQTSWKSLDMVVGIEIRRSNHPYKCDRCERLKGKYPKGFVFTGWHPNCRCAMLPILFTREEMTEYTRRILADEKPEDVRSSMEIKELPAEFLEYVKEKRETFEKSSSPPYWIKDNFVGGNLSKPILNQ